jgi:hypothetical protein
MMRKSEPVRDILLIGLIAVLLCSTVQAPGLGISPPSFTVADALRGGEYERTITVFNTADDDGDYELGATGPESGWITFYHTDDPETPITALTIKGHTKERVLVKIQVADDASNRDYTPTIYVKSIPPEATAGAGGAVAHAVLKMPVSATIQVTGVQILKGTVESITTADTEIGYPLRIKVAFKNDGNVGANPKIAIRITKDGTHIDSFVHDASGIKPGKADTINIPWNTTEPGDYSASVSVSLGDETLATKDVPFTILPRGAITRKGVLESLSLEGEPVVNRVIKVLAAFENTGTSDARAKFKGELYRDGELVDVLESEEKLVVAGEKPQLIAYYKITVPGEYKIEGIVCYEGKDTEVKEVSFTALELEEEEKKKKPWIPGFEFLSTLIALIISIMIIINITKRRAKR